MEPDICLHLQHIRFIAGMSREPLFQQSQHALEWPSLLDVLASQAHSSLGAAFCQSLPLADSYSAAQSRLQETTEMIALSDGPLPFPSLPFHDTRSGLLRAEKGATLDAKELRRLANVINLLVQVRRCLTAQKDLAPHLFRYLDHLDDLSFLQSEIDQCISEEGEVLDHASSALYDAVQDAQGLKSRMRQRLESMMTSATYRDALQELYFDQRENRYVLPIKVDMQHQVQGIVHDVSSSGLTVFLEPRELIELNNRIKVADLEVDREIRRILTELSSMVVGHISTIQRYLEVLAILDSIGAKARLSQRMDAYPVELSEDGQIRLHQARHPLLVLARAEVIPNDITMEKDQKVLVISGPNTGGKTVNLKLLGLYSLMVRAGLHLPCAEGSQMGFFTDTFADIGDTQDLAKDLSSFSAHLTKIIQLLDVGHAQPSTPFGPILVLLDEVISSTDPAEGAALAEALLLHFADLGFKVVVTTHYNSLKTLALSTPGFLNASLEFDVATLTPTYRLIQGVPGGSSALDIAGRLGMAPSILEHATKVLDQQDRELDHIFSDLQSMHHRLRQELESVEMHRRRTEEAAMEAQERLDRIRGTERDELQKIKKKLKEELGRARTEIRETVASLKQDKTLVKAQEAKVRVHEIAEDLDRRTQDDSETVPLENLQVGALVEISNLGALGTLIEAPQGKKRVRVRVGETELSVGVDLLVGRVLVGEGSFPKPPVSKAPRKKSFPKGFAEKTFTSPSTSGLLTIDLRGQTVEDALESLVSRLDEALLTVAKTVHIIHGHGTGKLKMATRKFLANASYVESYRPGEQGEGGDGVTVAELR
ncbi:endonuclease MutS2 [Candidatus Nitronereus thalassa]|uniref:Endonuclease MutS2 n=1 Tax=Candidatus Nitronereus thalassa TaxID=3020898 RepID=A0ABU3K4G3_9BACT|nr:endonuclease MutS2 [Candidatus Nitronereus thalassa]MDT7041310.1 endonuclease MutS2 [Candidatus Nitronereus thalassa]